MNRKRSLLPLLLALAATALAACSTPQSGPAEWDGLVRRPHPRLNAVFVKPDTEIGAFRNVMLDPVEINFAEAWDPSRGTRRVSSRLNASDIAAIKAGLAELFRETFRAELERGGYQLVDEAGPETLRVIPAIVDLYIAAPDTMSTAGRTRTYTTNSGRMTLVVELRDSVTGEILARAIDGRSGRGTGQWNITNNVTNTADARRAISVWATALRQALEELYERAK